MKRAAVWRSRALPSQRRPWYAVIYPATEHLPDVETYWQGQACVLSDDRYPTHAAALTAALEAVGLSGTNPEKEN